MIVVTGGAGFIGSAVVWKLNRQGHDNIVIVDELGTGEKWKNLNGLQFADYFDKIDFIDMILADEVPFSIKAVIHLGACSSTTEKDADYLIENNFKYSQALANYCLEKDARFIYASSAATYGDGSLGYDDSTDKLDDLRPLNMYGYSKHLFDLWIKNNNLLDRVVGLKYFNVFGPNEYHKGEMRSVVHKAFEQVRETGKVKLFKSYKDGINDGEQKRDFIYVKDAVDITLHFLDDDEKNGIYNIGSGKAHTWNELVTALFSALNKPANIEYIEMPADLREKYQYFTEANLEKLREAEYTNPVIGLEESVKDYVQNYLLKEKYLGMSS